MDDSLVDYAVWHDQSSVAGQTDLLFGIANGYWFRKEDSTPWQNSSQFTISGNLRFSESVVVYMDVETSAGKGYLQYNVWDIDTLGDGRYVHHGLGGEAMDGKWLTVFRDLEVDLHDAQPDVRNVEKINHPILHRIFTLHFITPQSQHPRNRVTIPVVLLNRHGKI